MSSFTFNNLTTDELRKLEERELEDYEIKALDKGIEKRYAHRAGSWRSPKDPCPVTTGTDNINIVLVGLGGVGKSAIGNLIAGTMCFKSSMSASAETKSVQTQRVNLSRDPESGSPKETIIVSDTPGFLIEDMIKSKKKLMENKELIDQGCRSIREPIDVFILVTNLASPRLRRQEIEVLEQTKLLNSKSLNHFMLVATHAGGTYGKNGVDDFEKDARMDEEAGKFLDKIRKRFVLVELGTGLANVDFDASAPSTRELQQARQMVLSIVDEVVRTNAGTRYTLEELKEEVKKCFPGQSIVTTPFGDKMMSDLDLGDKVKVIDAAGHVKFEEIFMFGRAVPGVKSSYIKIQTKEGKAIHMSAGHFIPVGDLDNLKDVSDIKVGDIIFIEEDGQVKDSQVTSVSTNTLDGFYSPKTPSGKIIVDGVVASCYTNIAPLFVSRAAMLPVRLMYKMLPTEWFKWILPYNAEQGMPEAALKLMKIFTSLLW